MALFRRPTVRYGRTPEPETPYQRAAQVWDDRIGSARVQAKNWRLMAFGSLALSMGLAGGLVWQSTHGTIVPWVVQVDKLGQAQAVAPAAADYTPSDPQIAWYLAHFVQMVRVAAGRSDHRAAELAAGLRLHHHLGLPGAQRLRPRQRPLRQARQAADRHRRLERDPRLALELPRRMGRASLPGRRARRQHRAGPRSSPSRSRRRPPPTCSARTRSASTSPPSTGRRS